MVIVFERFKREGIAQLSYLIGDDETRTAAVIDPLPNAGMYLRAARRFGVSITHVLETHIHADFMSGARELVSAAGGAELCASIEGDASYGFDISPLRDGETISLGTVRLTARHTPGHTPEHLAFLISEAGRENDPWAVLTGDALFVGSAGRPDLLGEEATQHLTRQLHATLRNFFLTLDDGVIILPCHGAGSACGPDIGDRPMSTIGFERRTNPYLQYDDPDAFSDFIESTAPPEPHHYRRLKKLNASGPPIVSDGPAVPAMPPRAFRQAIEAGRGQLIDTRDLLAFGGRHIEGAWNIGAQPELAVWAGEMIDAERPVLLIAERDEDIPWIVEQFVSVGLTRLDGYLAGGMKAWDDAGLPIASLGLRSVHELHDHLHETQILDVRSPDEWNDGHIPHSIHAYVANLRDGLDGADRLDRDRPVTVYCDSGYRASLASSILLSRGFHDVSNVPGSWKAWTASDYPVETEQPAGVASP